jgi:hypothetical protein
MQLKELKSILESTGMPVAFNHFDNQETTPPPYIVYFTPECQEVYADGIVVFQVTTIEILLYTAIKDLEAEQSLERTLNKCGLAYEKSQAWIDQDRLYETLYETELEESP